MAKTNGNYGIVYVLVNLAMPGLVKIGMTTRNEIDSRLRELYSTGVPLPFECRYACLVEVSDCGKVEKALHKAFYKNRINTSREFFDIDPEQAIAILELLDKREITNEVVEELANDITLADKVAAENFKKKRRPPLNFREMGIPRGAKLQLIDDQNIEVEVCGDRKILFNGIETSLTAATKELHHIDHALQPTPYWTYKGKSLSDIYNETYTTEEE
ncbi:GIY-YIG nuclease family protein [Dysgonomonas sp. HDW5B]|uniref:GIY-YIG nuclease family protein n=1 Tax=Dysgonomonas sp. HDW5B TaxID=2714927 RepID=UPI00140BCB53|nr:GIY-YIG nuclease family protein [Dysgonomonas sp. HDW5B]QIK53117.1 GIY-YIG nuclease family protein [Dysgonomonas sp. HDW5B]